MKVPGRGGGGGGIIRYNHDRESSVKSRSGVQFFNTVFKGERLLLGLEIFVMTLCGGKILVTLASLSWS